MSKPDAIATDTGYSRTPKEQNREGEEDDKSRSEINSPELDEKGKPTRKAIESAAQAHAIAKAIWKDADEGRLKIAAVVLEKYNGGQPFNPIDLKNEQADWRNNFSTNWLASIIDRVVPQLRDPLQNIDMLTRSSLPESVENSAEKSRKFQAKVTRTIRRWSGWKDFLSMLAQENSTHGGAIPAWLDDNWRPRVYRTDEIALPQGTGQHASKIQVMVVKQSLLLHEFVDLLSDTGSAELADYNLENCAKLINKSYSKNANVEGKSEGKAIALQDAIRETGSMGSTYAESGIKVVNLYHVIVREYEGGVALWTVPQEDAMEIRHVEKLHECMEDAATLFTLQTGNTKFYGSKGLGRMLVNLHIAIERARCLAADQAYLSGLVILQADAGTFNTLRPTVRSPFIIIPTDAKISSEQIAFSATDWQLIDQHLNQLGESIAGAFIPPNIDTQGSATTKIEAAQKAEREIAVRQGVLGRFIGQGYELVGAIQRKICSDTNLKEAKRVYDNRQKQQDSGFKMLARKVWELVKSVLGDDGTKDKYKPDLETKIADQEAVDCIVSIMEDGLTIEEIVALALSPAAGNEEQVGSDQDGATVQFIQNNAMNPLLNQVEAFKMMGEISIGADRTKRLIQPMDDPTVTAVATRQQLIELSEMMQGVPMPVAPTDQHDIHRKLLAGHFGPLMDAMAKGTTPPSPEIISTAELVIPHYLEHIEKDMMMPKDQAKQESEAIKGWQQTIDRAKQSLQKAAEIVAQSSQGQSAGMPPEGATGAAGAPPAEAEEPGIHDTIKAAATVHEQSLKAGDQALRARELDLKEREQQHKEAVDTAHVTTEATKIVADEAARAHEQGMQAAALDLQQNQTPKA